MEENGLGIALEVIYTPVTASHVEWKSLWGNSVCASTVQLIDLKELWGSLNSKQQNELKNTCK